MNEPTSATFSFTGHKLRKFTFNVPDVEPENLMIEFEPSGEYSQDTSVYTLNLRLMAKYEDKGEHKFADITIEGIYQFAEKTNLEKIPPYFYANSIAIIYPYLRAIMTVITSVGNIKPLILPTLNLESLSNPLKENTVCK